MVEKYIGKYSIDNYICVLSRSKSKQDWLVRCNLFNSNSIEVDQIGARYLPNVYQEDEYRVFDKIGKSKKGKLFLGKPSF